MDEHEFVGKNKCPRDGLYYDVDANNVCKGCNRRLKIIEVEDGDVSSVR